MDSKRFIALRFPRAVIRNEHLQGYELCWFLLNFFLVFGVVPTVWMREVNFIRKRGPQLGTDLKTCGQSAIIPFGLASKM